MIVDIKDIENRLTIFNVNHLICSQTYFLSISNALKFICIMKYDYYECKRWLLARLQNIFITIQYGLYYSLLFLRPIYFGSCSFVIDCASSIQFAAADLIPFIPSNLPSVNVWSYYAENDIMMKISQRFGNWHLRI